MLDRYPPDSYFLALLLAQSLSTERENRPGRILLYGVNLSFEKFKPNIKKYVDYIRSVLEKYNVDYYRLVQFYSGWDEEKDLPIVRTSGGAGQRFNWNDRDIGKAFLLKSVKIKIYRRWPEFDTLFRESPDPRKPTWGKGNVEPGPNGEACLPLMESAILTEILRWVNDCELKSIDERLSHFETEMDREDLRYQFNQFAEKTIRRWFFNHGWSVPQIAEPEQETEPEITSSPSDLEIQSREREVMTNTIKQQKDTIKALKIRQDRPSLDELKTYIDQHRKGTGKVNYTKLGKILGRDPDTIKRWIEKAGLLGYALNE